jgi:hypothetical protein
MLLARGLLQHARAYVVMFFLSFAIVVRKLKLDLFCLQYGTYCISVLRYSPLLTTMAAGDRFPPATQRGD